MNIEKYKKDLDDLIARGDILYLGMLVETYPEQKEGLKKRYKPKEWEEVSKKLKFRDNYQIWYSEALECVRQLLPFRVEDFTSFYKEKTKRKEITNETYAIHDYLQGLSVTFGSAERKVAGPDAAIPKFQQQLNIVKSLKKKFESTLFDIRHLVQADVFDDELEVSGELLKKGFLRAAGAVAGVVLEGHLEAVCDGHGVTITTKNPTISDFNDLLKKSDVIDTPTWRKIQYLGDIRNQCDHKKKTDPKPENIEELIAGVQKITKTIF